MKIPTGKCQFSYKLGVKIIKTGMDNAPDGPLQLFNAEGFDES